MDPRQRKEERMRVDGQWYVSVEGGEEGFLGDSFDVSLGVGWKDRGRDGECVAGSRVGD